ncbi:MAG TPA: HlyD family efflux transporter periplasmic adaptor subunit [Paludibacter sp.]|nr:HlyD family efflux transporter periplasmic adaptor subunit [Paludibacter sp.]
MKTTKKTWNKVSIKQLAFTTTAALLFASCGKSGNDYDATGIFETTEIVVSAEGTGKILSFAVEEGQAVKQDETLGTIDSTQLYLRKKQLIASQKAMQSRRPDIRKQMAALEQQIATAKQERKRVENLLKANAASQKQLDDANAQISVLEKQLDAQKTALTTSNQGISDESEGLSLQIAQIDDQLRKCRIASPIDGTVLVKYAEMGEVAAPGKALLKVADINNMILRAYITDKQLAGLKLGQKVKVSADAGEDSTRDYEGTLTWISSKSEFTPKTIQTQDERANLVYAIKISVKNDGFLKIGMYGQVEFAPQANN